jgi:dipeptidase
MCDTVIIPAAFTQHGNTLFAKNSDREPSEAQPLLHVPRTKPGSRTVRCTFIDIPQVDETYEVILSKPFQMWGAEMGANEFGVVIGNEAVFTKARFKKDNSGLTGMDMLRLALERSSSAAEARDCIISLLGTHGQDACGGYKNRKFFYHNSFLISDAREAFVLETVDREWAFERVSSIRSISNRLTIQQGEFSPRAQSLATDKGWWRRSQQPLSFEKAYSDLLFTWAGQGKYRQKCTSQYCLSHSGRMTAQLGMELLQTHHRPHPQFKPSRANTRCVCMHATGLLNPSSTTGSMVAEIRSSQPSTFWFTGTPHPCLSIYMPFFTATTALQEYNGSVSKPNPLLWVRAKRLHRWIADDYPNRRQALEPERQELQSLFIERERQLIQQGASLQILNQFSLDCLHQVESFVQRHAEQAERSKINFPAILPEQS